ncbi:cation:proton antiporter [Streptomyces sp. ALI-76-A]|uniref:cation:proton antiporter n=1 Tax=Streptomyces sp. ALI-76-A TaxID=3025736 RepID=UPI00256ED5D8|nr:cation:proton antiporter [Streptomyces sp. ALI-76-A]MDL5199284.1 cation:proton antiporter [Streptomyces sp. ALI-76-A]
MTISDAVFAWLGVGALLAAVLPRVVAGRPLSLPLVFLMGGMCVYLLPLPLPVVDPVEDRLLTEHVTEIGVLIALMGAGLALNRPVGRRRWATTWRLLGVTMPLTVLVTALVAWWLLGWPPAAALLLAAVLAPTDPVLASEVRVGEPTEDEHDEDEVRFALTSEAGLNDGLAFPLTYAAVALAAAAGSGWSAGWIGAWVAEDVGYKCAVGVLSGWLSGRLLGWLFFRPRSSALRLSEHREGFVALGATFLSYGVTELVGGYGFLAVFTTACTIRAAERAHGFHKVLHDFVEQIERLFTAAVLFLLGAFIALGGLSALTWQGAVTALVVLLVIRPLSGWAGLLGGRVRGRERWVVAGYGIRGIGSLYYLAYALGQQHFPVPERELWAVVTFTVLVSVVLHGVTAGPVVSRLDRRRTAEAERPGEVRGDVEVGGAHSGRPGETREDADVEVNGARSGRPGETREDADVQVSGAGSGRPEGTHEDGNVEVSGARSGRPGQAGGDGGRGSGTRPGRPGE